MQHMELTLANGGRATVPFVTIGKVTWNPEAPGGQCTRVHYYDQAWTEKVIDIIFAQEPEKKSFENFGDRYLVAELQIGNDKFTDSLKLYKKLSILSGAAICKP